MKQEKSITPTTAADDINGRLKRQSEKEKGEIESERIDDPLNEEMDTVEEDSTTVLEGRSSRIEKLTPRKKKPLET